MRACRFAWIAALCLLPAAAPGAPGTVRVLYAPEGAASDPGDPRWRAAPAQNLTLSGQLITAPVGGGSVASVAVRAVHDGEWLAIRLDWEDASADRTVGSDTFRDAAAVGFPSRDAPAAPSPFMGDADHPVNIWQWSADLEATAAGRGGFAERYPHTDGVWYFPQDAAVQREVRSWRGVDPVVEFGATGWGTLVHHPIRQVVGRSQHEKGRWQVVLRRRLQTGRPEDAAFRPGETTQIIVAVWNGSAGDVNGRKSVTLGWVPFALDATAGADVR